MEKKRKQKYPICLPLTAQCPLDGDPGFCQFWPKRYCQMYYNVPEECPYKCGICKQDGTAVTSGGGNAGTGSNAPTEGEMV